MKAGHMLRALQAVAGREVSKFIQQRGRLFSALVRPTLWLVVFAAGFQNVFGVSIIPPYETYIKYEVYIMPGLLGMVLLFNGMQSSLAMVYDREMGMMRLLLTAPLPRWYLLLTKLLAGTLLSVIQAYAFLIIVALFNVDVALDMPSWFFGSVDTYSVTIPWLSWILVLPALILGGMMLGALGLLLSVSVKQLENFAGTMNFVIFPMFFISPALYPLWKLQESGAEWIYFLASWNPFSHAVELIRFAFYGQFAWQSFIIVVISLIIFFVLAAWGYDPQRGMMRRSGRPG
jgi:ABC-2 type transport system permease protein